jgi:hypothetical protein
LEASILISSTGLIFLPPPSAHFIEYDAAAGGTYGCPAGHDFLGKENSKPASILPNQEPAGQLPQLPQFRRPLKYHCLY